MFVPYDHDLTSASRIANAAITATTIDCVYDPAYYLKFYILNRNSTKVEDIACQALATKVVTIVT